MHLRCSSVTASVTAQLYSSVTAPLHLRYSSVTAPVTAQLYSSVTVLLQVRYQVAASATAPLQLPLQHRCSR